MRIMKCIYSIGLMAIMCGAAESEGPLYQKDFATDTAAGWKGGELNYNDGNARVVNGELKIDGRRMAYYGPGVEWRNYIVEFEAKVDQWNTKEEGPWKRTGFRLLFRVKDGSSYYALTMAESGLVLMAIGGGTTRETADLTLIKNKVTGGTWWGSALRPHELGKFYKIKVEVNGAEATVFEDDEKAFSCKFVNDCIETGSIGMGSLFATGCVRKITVTKLPDTQEDKARNIFEED